MKLQLDRFNSRAHGSNASGGACDRDGATIIEVMFSIGILLFGLVGIAAFIPAASKLARNSIDLNRGASIGQTVTQEFNARGYGETARWRRIDDSLGSGTVANVPRNAVTALPAPVAIDPLFVSRRENLVAAGSVIGISEGQYNRFVPGTSNYFRRGLFPYYDFTHNPLIDPRLGTQTNAWPQTMPRLVRAIVGERGTGSVPSPLAAGRLTDDVDQLVFNTPQDKTLPVSQVMRIGAVAPSNAAFPIPAARSGRPEYSWFATVQPQSPTTGTLSVVVISGRDRTFATPADGTPPSAEPSEPLEVPERLAYVSSAVANFRGGAGGTVTLTASANVSSELRTDGWVMLMRNTVDLVNGVPQLGPPRHAWYRVVQADREAIFDTNFPDPGGGPNKNVWHRNVTLEGPDWTFNEIPGVADDTLAVLVDGVVSVTESTVPLR